MVRRFGSLGKEQVTQGEAGVWSIWVTFGTTMATTLKIISISSLINCLNFGLSDSFEFYNILTEF